MLVFFTGCKKPKIGRYALVLNTSPAIYGDEIKVTSKEITYGGAFSKFSGTLKKERSKVSGNLEYIIDNKYKYSIFVKGIIVKDGALFKYKITGDFTDNSNNTGKFTITKISD